MAGKVRSPEKAVAPPSAHEHRPQVNEPKVGPHDQVDGRQQVDTAFTFSALPSPYPIPETPKLAARRRASKNPSASWESNAVQLPEARRSTIIQQTHAAYSKDQKGYDLQKIYEILQIHCHFSPTQADIILYIWQSFGHLTYCDEEEEKYVRVKKLGGAVDDSLNTFFSVPVEIPQRNGHDLPSFYSWRLIPRERALAQCVIDAMSAPPGVNNEDSIS